MSGELHPPTRPPLLSAEQAARMLDELVFERVLSFIDLDALFLFEQDLWCAYEEVGAGGAHIAGVVKGMIDRAFVRLCDDPRRYMSFGGAPLGTTPLGASPFGANPFGDCDLCEQEAEEAAAARTRAAIGKRRKTG